MVDTQPGPYAYPKQTIIHADSKKLLTHKTKNISITVKEPFKKDIKKMKIITDFLKKKTQPSEEKEIENKKGPDHELINNNYEDSELVIALVGAAGTDLNAVYNIIHNRMKAFNYNPERIRISTDILGGLGFSPSTESEYRRIISCMEEGNRLRKESKDNSFLALCSAAKINERRANLSGGINQLKPMQRTCFVIQSLKHPEEVQRLKNIYSSGFFLLGVHSQDERRLSHLTEKMRMSKNNAKAIMEKDYSEKEPHGQHTSETFHLSDFFITYDEDNDKLERSIWRILDLIFGAPFITPTFDEYAMFMAFSASVRSADLSRQVGAVIARKKNILSTGANDVPSPKGGLYWPYFDAETKGVIDVENGRDYKRGFDSNSREKNEIIRKIMDEIREIDSLSEESIEEILPIIKKSSIKDITEYGRVVHAEMDAILGCARNKIQTQDSTLYCTTFPCHNCAKHIIASGIKRVVFVQPYSKSKALDFHGDSISFEDSKNQRGEPLVKFEPFIGVGPRNFLNFFSMDLGMGYPLRRKEDDGSATPWKRAKSRLRMQLLPCSYIERETLASNRTIELLERINETK